jgi:hypothetical protein
MICFAKPGLAEDLYVVKKVEFVITWYMCDTYIRHRPFLFIRDETKRKNSGRDPQGAWRQDELIGGKPPVEKYL